MIKYPPPPLSEVVSWPLEVVVRALKKAHIYALCKKKDQCHKLLLVLGGNLALTHSYSERWRIAPATFDRIVLLYTRAGKIKKRILVWSLSGQLDGKG